MKSLFAGLAAAAAISTPGLSADMPVKAPPPAVTSYDWSGLYVGFNAGHGRAEVDRFFPRLDLVGLVPQTFTSKNDGAIFGFHGGVQGQWGNWVLGIEAAWSRGAKDLRGVVSLSPPEPFTTLGADNTITELFTIGPRLGYAWDRLLVYGTGGYAGAHIDGRYICTATGIPVLPGPACGVFAGALAAIDATGHSWNHGWFVGAGFEYMLHKGSFVDVIFGAEYQHFELDDKVAFCTRAGCAVQTQQDHINFQQGAHGDLVRARLTIKTQGWQFFN